MSNIHAVVKATYTKDQASAKASVRYFAHRVDREGNRITRAIFGSNGLVSKDRAYRMIDQTRGRAYFYRIVLSPERSTGEDRDLPQITRQTMRQLQKIVRSNRPIPFLAVAHTDHSDTPHVHALAVLRTYLTEEKMTKLREALERVVVTGNLQQSAQTPRTARHQLSASGVRTRSVGRPFARTLRWRAHPMPARQDIFIAKSVVNSGATRGGGVTRVTYNPGRKLFVCPGCNQSAKLKKVDTYFECKRCGMEIGRRSNRHIFAERGGGQSYS